jgi:hypothetical protein
LSQIGQIEKILGHIAHPTKPILKNKIDLHKIAGLDRLRTLVASFPLRAKPFDQKDSLATSCTAGSQCRSLRPSPSAIAVLSFWLGQGFGFRCVLR